jgi:hypothetical protein
MDWDKMIENGKKTSVAEILNREHDEFFGEELKKIDLALSAKRIREEVNKLPYEERERYLQVALAIINQK